MTSANPVPKTTQAYLLITVNKYLEEHPDITAESFGWLSIGESSLVKRLRQGKDVTTKTLDLILAFIHYNH